MDDYVLALIGAWEGRPEPESPEPEDPRPERLEAPPRAPDWRTAFEDAPGNTRLRACDEFVGPFEHDFLYAHCSSLPYWEFDKPLGHFGNLQRRGVCMQAVPGVGGYRYSGQEVVARPLDEVLGPLLARVNRELGTSFNSWFLNYFRPRGRWGSDGDYISAHSDDEKSLVRGPQGLVVFGLTLTDHPECCRVLRLQAKKEPKRKFDLITRGGQAYTMEGDCQKHYLHGIPQALSVPGARISLTARKFELAAK